MNSRYDYLELVPIEHPKHIAPSTCKRPAKRKSHALTYAALIGALVGFAVHLATSV